MKREWNRRKWVLKTKDLPCGGENEPNFQIPHKPSQTASNLPLPSRVRHVEPVGWTSLLVDISKSVLPVITIGYCGVTGQSRGRIGRGMCGFQTARARSRTRECRVQLLLCTWLSLSFGREGRGATKGVTSSEDLPQGIRFNTCSRASLGSLELLLASQWRTGTMYVGGTLP